MVVVPNFACSIKSLAKAMAVFSNPNQLEKNRKRYIEDLKNAVLSHPDLFQENNDYSPK